MHRYVEPAEVSPEENKIFLDSLNNMNISHKNLRPLQEARCDAITSENAIRLGGLFCLFCGKGPMRSSCACQANDNRAVIEYNSHCDSSMIQKQTTPRWCLQHTHPCGLHNHCVPNGICEGRCIDCGGCNQNPEDCTHYNPSGGPTHPDPSNTVSLPYCARTSEDKTRCYRQYQPPVIEEEEEGTTMKITPANQRTALILLGGREREEEETEEFLEEAARREKEEEEALTNLNTTKGNKKKSKKAKVKKKKSKK